MKNWTKLTLPNSINLLFCWAQSASKKKRKVAQFNKPNTQPSYVPCTWSLNLLLRCARYMIPPLIFFLPFFVSAKQNPQKKNQRTPTLLHPHLHSSFIASFPSLRQLSVFNCQTASTPPLLSLIFTIQASCEIKVWGLKVDSV